MARYIKSNILFQSYVHIEAPFEKIKEEGQEITIHLTEFVTERAEHFLYPEVDVDLEFKEGSIKTYATVRGTLRQCLRENYQDFSTEIDHLYWFSKRLSDGANMEVAFRTGAFLGAIERTEARPGIIGQTKRIVDGLLSFRAVETEKAAGILLKRVRQTRIDAENLLKNLADDLDKDLVKNEFRAMLKLAPKKLNSLKPFSSKQEFDYEEGIAKFAKLLEASPQTKAS